MAIFGKPYFTEEELENIKNYKYSAVNKSISYKYIKSPLAQWLVDKFIPTWMSPNVITTIGFLVFLSSAIIAIVYDPKLDTRPPNWVLVSMGFGHLFYNIMDNMDGKQARKTGSSSSLGQLFDHGFDSIVAGLVVQTLATYVNIPVSALAMMLVTGFLGFYGGTWSEYLTGKLHFWYINGVDEGNLFVIFFEIFFGFKPELLDIHLFTFAGYDITLGLFFLILGAPAISYPFFTSLFNNWRSKRVKEEGWKPYIFGMVPLISPILFEVYLFVFNTTFLEKHPRILLTIFGLYNSNMCIRVMVAAMSRNYKDFWLKKRLHIWSVPLYLFYGYHWITRTPINPVYEEYMLFSYFVFAIVVHTLYIAGIMREIAAYMKIPIFKMPKTVKRD